MVIGKIGADLRPIVPIVVQGANGQERKIPVLSARILLAGEAQDVDELARGYEAHIESRLLEEYRVSMRFVDGGAVCVERL